MLALRRSVAAGVIVSLFFSATGVAGAQSAFPAVGDASASAQGVQANDTLAAGLLDGETLGEGRRTGGKLGAGLGIGLLTGVIGTGIGYFVIGPDPLSAEALARSINKSADYQLGLKTGWERKTQSKKRNAFLAGGLLGTVAWIALITSGDSQ
jgi:hypothetical protein